MQNNCCGWIFVLVWTLTAATEHVEILNQEYIEAVAKKRSEGYSHSEMRAAGCPQTSFDFPNKKQITNYIRLTEPVPDLDELTACGRFNLHDDQVEHRWISYFKNGDAYLMLIDTSGILITLNNKYARFNMKFYKHREYHICIVTLAKTNGISYIFVNGDLRGMIDLPAGTVRGGGVFLLGQDQDSAGGQFQDFQAARGILSNFMFWSRALQLEELQEMYRNRCVCPQDYLFTLERGNIEIFGGATALTPLSCQ